MSRNFSSGTTTAKMTTSLRKRSGAADEISALPKTRAKQVLSLVIVLLFGDRLGDGSDLTAMRCFPVSTDRSPGKAQRRRKKPNNWTASGSASHGGQSR